MADGLVVTIDAGEFEQALDVAIGAFVSGDDPDLRDGLRDAGAAYLDFIQKRFLIYAAGGGDWEPLAVSTAEQKSRAGYDSRIGIADGTMYHSLTPGAPGNILDVQGLLVRIGSSDPHIGYFHSGTTKMPGRPVFVDADESTEAEIQRRIGAAVQKAVDRIFGR